MTSDLGMASLKMIGSLMIVLGLIIGLFYALKRLRIRAFQSGPARQMRLITTLNLAPKRTLALVELNDEWFLIGVGTESVRLITRVDRPPEKEPAGAADSGNGRSFHMLLQQSGLWRPGSKETAKERQDEA
ncbi:MAG: flagellar biosynthetic protein FliO [Thermodesulfobacteriota bacterium]